MNINKKTAIKIKNLREKIGITSESVAIDLGISKSAFSQLENGHTEITLKRLKQISEVFKVSIESLLPNTKQTIQINKDNSYGNIQNQYNSSDKESLNLLKDSLKNLNMLLEKLTPTA